MADESLLEGLDPSDLIETEADRVHRHFTSSPNWARPSRCAGWTTRDMLGHLMGLEDYTRAGLDNRVRAFFRAAKEAGASDLAAFNDWQIQTYADVPADELVARWRNANLASRAELRSRGRDGSVDTSIGQYPSWLQTWHYAVEYATHGDDVFVRVDESERAGRTTWRVAFGRFVPAELEKPVQVEPLEGGLLRVTGDAGTAELSSEEFVEATQGRLPDEHSLGVELRELLSTVP